MRKTAEANFIAQEENALKASGPQVGLIKKAMNVYDTKGGKILSAIALLAGAALLGGGGGGNPPDADGQPSEPASEGARDQRLEAVSIMAAKQLPMMREMAKAKADARKIGAFSKAEEKMLAKNAGIEKRGLWYGRVGEAGAVSREEMEAELKKMRAGKISSKVINKIKAAGGVIKDSKMLARIRGFIREVKPVLKSAQKVRAAIKPVEDVLKKAGVTLGNWAGPLFKLVMVCAAFADTIEDAIKYGALSPQVFKDFCMNLGQLLAVSSLVLFAQPLQAAIARWGYAIGLEMGAAFGATVGLIFPPAEALTIPFGLAMGGLTTLAIDAIVTFLTQEFGGDAGLFFHDWLSTGNLSSSASNLFSRIYAAAKNVVKKAVISSISGVVGTISGLFGFGSKPAEKAATPKGAPAAGGAPFANSQSGSGANAPSYSGATGATGGAGAAGSGARAYARIAKKRAPNLDFNRKFKDLSHEDQDKYLDIMAINEGTSPTNVNHRHNNPGNILWTKGDQKLLTKYGAVEGEHKGRYAYARFPSWQAGLEAAREKLSHGRYENMTLAQDADLWTTGSVGGSGSGSGVGPSSGSSDASKSGGGGSGSYTPTYYTPSSSGSGGNRPGISSNAIMANPNAGRRVSKEESDYAKSTVGGDNSKFGGKASELHSGNKLKDRVGDLIYLNGGRTGSARNLEHIDPKLEGPMIKVLSEFKQKKHRGITLTSGFRYPGDQAHVPHGTNPVAKPGHSRHERGLALDFSSADVSEINKLGLFTKYGLRGGVAGSARGGVIKDGPHVEINGPGGSGTTVSGGSDDSSSSDASPSSDKTSKTGSSSDASPSSNQSGPGNKNATMEDPGYNSDARPSPSAVSSVPKSTTEPLAKSRQSSPDSQSKQDDKTTVMNATMANPNIKTPSIQPPAQQYGIPDPKFPVNRADDYSVFFNANEPAFGIPMHNT
jgi:hypothetical protein